MAQRQRMVLVCFLGLLSLVACSGRSVRGENDNQNNNNTAPTCGNNVAEINELCDGADLRENNCSTVDVAFSGGILGCGPTCDTWDTSSCEVVTQECGDGIREGTELCDTSDLNGNDCTTIGEGFTGGTLSCGATCDSWITTGCTDEAYVCGNGVREGPEVCDGTDLGMESCTTHGYSEGVLNCSALCDAFILTGCYDGVGTCGDGVVQPPELCDGVANAASCSDFGYTGGTIGCTADCRFNLAGCTGDYCQESGLYNDGNCDLCELYGGTTDPDCQSLCGLADGTCRSWVDLLTLQSTCVASTGTEDPDCGSCGDGIRDQAEWCDGADIPSFLDCTSLGFVSGPLGCDTNCVFDTSQCVAAVCGDGSAEPGEQCDDGNTSSGDGCNSNCMYETGNETEPNDTPTQAATNNSFTPDTAVIGGWSLATDVDYYAVTVSAGQSLEIQTWDHTGPSCTIDTELWVYDSDEVTVLAYNDDSTSLCAHIDPNIEAGVQNLPAGTYYVRVGNVSGTSGVYLIAFLSAN